MSSRPRLKQRLRYAFDNTMSRGAWALVAWLGAVTLLLILVFTVIVQVFDLGPYDDGPHSGVIGETFYTMLHALDPGTIAGDDGAWTFLLAMLLVTFGGLFIFSALISIISAGLDSRIQDLRKGRSLVIEQDHTLILGWGKPVFTILNELDIACEGEKDPVAVVLSETDKVEMDDTLRERVQLRNLRVVTRSGSPIDLGDLALARPEAASSILVLAPEDGSEADAHVIKTILALSKLLKDESAERGVIAEISDPSKLAPARLAGGDRTVLIDRRETVAKLLVQAARQGGISVAVQELLDFDGHEIYMIPAGDLAGRTYAQGLGAFETCALIGLLDEEERVEINPPGERVIGEGDTLIAIAEDDTVLDLREPALTQADPAAAAPLTPEETRPERVVILGWNAGGSAVVRHFDAFLAPGSEIVVVAGLKSGLGEDEEQVIAATAAEISFRRADTTDISVLQGLELDRTDHVMVLACSGELDDQRADARTLVTLLHLREIEQGLDPGFSIVTELVDERSRQLAEVAEVDDVIVSENVVSLLFAQVSQNRHLAEVFTQLFSPEGSEIYLKPVERYVPMGAKVDFATLVGSAQRYAESAIGYRRSAESSDPDAGYGMTINPTKSETFEVRAGDRLIVLAED